MKWNEYNAAVSTSTESVRTDSLVRRNPENPAAENKKPNRTRNNKITVYLNDAELARLNAMVDKTVMMALAAHESAVAQGRPDGFACQEKS